MTTEEKKLYLAKIAAEVGEHFDCVQILAHDSDSESFTTFEAGVGSLFARQYHAMRWTEEAQEPVEIENDDDDEYQPTGD